MQIKKAFIAQTKTEKSLKYNIDSMEPGNTGLINSVPLNKFAEYFISWY